MKAILWTLLVTPSLLLATAQFPDTLLYHGKSESIFSTPLEDYFQKTAARPKWLTATSTACWRGYIASWELRADRLFLTQITRREFDSKGDQYVERDISKKVFRRQSLPIEATWFSGVIRLPQGKQLEYVHLGFESVYEKDLFLEFKNGVLANTRIVRNAPSPPAKSGNN